MKEVGLNTTGGRVRKVRKDAEKSMREFGEMIGVTGNYVGLLERGERNPSAELLQKISSIMGISYEWLVNGDPQEQTPNTDDEMIDPAPMVNPRLYFSVAMGMASGVTKEALVPILAVPPQTIDAILAGEDVKYNPRWRNGYTALARNLDLPALRRDLRKLYDYLEWEEREERNKALMYALKKHVEKTCKTEAVDVISINGQKPNAVLSHVSYTDIVFRCEGEFSETWYFKYLPEQEDIKDFEPSDILSYAEELADQNGITSASIVLTSEAEYDLMYRYFDKLEIYAEGEAVLGIASYRPMNISIIHFDLQTGEIDELEFPDDDDFPNVDI